MVVSMPEPWSLRPCVLQDLEYVVAVKERALRSELERLGVWSPERSRQRVAAAFSLLSTRIIESQGRPVGSISLRRRDDDRWLELFYLEPHLQGRGLGTAVLEQVLTELRDHVVRLDVLQGSPARRLYERHGFVFEAENEIDVFLVRRPTAQLGRRKQG